MAWERGKVYRVDLEPVKGSEQQGRARPCVIMSLTPLNQRLRQVGVVPLSSSAKALPPLVVPVPSQGQDSVALCHQLRTIDKSRMGKAMGELLPDELARIEDGLRALYGL